MSNKLREATVLRPSLKKQATQSRIRSKDTDTKRVYLQLIIFHEHFLMLLQTDLNDF